MNRNRIVLLCLGLLALVSSLFFAWFFVESKRFESAWRPYAAMLSARLAEADDVMAELARAPDITAQRQALNTLADSLTGSAMPRPPQLFGVGFGADAERRQFAVISDKLPAYAENLRTTTHFLEYQEQVATHLRPLALLAAGDEAKLRSLAARWQQEAQLLKEMAAPYTFTGAQNELVGYMQNASAIIFELADLHKAGDTPGFAAKYGLFRAEVSHIRHVATKIAQAATALDQERASLRAALQQNL